MAHTVSRHLVGNLLPNFGGVYFNKGVVNLEIVDKEREITMIPRVQK